MTRPDPDKTVDLQAKVAGTSDVVGELSIVRGLAGQTGGSSEIRAHFRLAPGPKIRTRETVLEFLARRLADHCNDRELDTGDADSKLIAEASNYTVGSLRNLKWKHGRIHNDEIASRARQLQKLDDIDR